MQHEYTTSAGREDFAWLIDNQAYYVDKTPYLKELFLGINKGSNELILRPRRFGKTLNLTTAYHFCRLNYQNPGDITYQQKLFIDNGIKLAVAGEEYRDLRERFMGQYPVIYVSFRGMEGPTFSSALSVLLGRIAALYENFQFLTQSPNQTRERKDLFARRYAFCQLERDKVAAGEQVAQACSIASDFLPALASMLHLEYARPVLILLDEYDVPLQKAVMAEEPYYDKMLDIIRKISVNTFKQDPEPWLLKGIVTGCLRIAHQSVFTGANNFVTVGLDSIRYSAYCGFTQEETACLLRDFDLADRSDEVKAWYDGYLFGTERVYCPWSLINFCTADAARGRRPKAYWMHTSGQDIIDLYLKNRVESADKHDLEMLQALLDHKSVAVRLQEFATYPDIKRGISFDAFATMLLHTGYLTYDDEAPAESSAEDLSDDLDEEPVWLKIPNREIRASLGKLIEPFYSAANPQWKQEASHILQALLQNRAEEAQQPLTAMLRRYLSVRNKGYESYYHDFLLGLLALSAPAGITLKDEQESREGYSDITLIDDDTRTAVVLELKVAAQHNFAALQRACEDALSQIRSKDYAQGFIDQGCLHVYGIGVAFAGKSCLIKSMGDLVLSSHA
ncbi:MAG: AAA family ATPase [Succinivibrio sp.]|nr:AAA family ATPase [Succinivibrio sp.]